jgi:hypothetical protein
MYKIDKNQKSNAKKINVTIKPSTNKNKKIDVYKNNKKVASIGDIKYKDYNIYLKNEGKPEATKRKDLYLNRHKNEPKNKNGVPTKSYYADKILWT